MSSTRYVALVDCNNFFVSCERLFRPDLLHRPVIVLSSNDGCVVSRSNEAKYLGIAMGEPYFKLKDRCRTHDVVVFSSNFPLYLDISRRVMHTLARFSHTVEPYSVDEAFLLPPLITRVLLERWMLDVRAALFREVGVPVSVGVARTKTLAKIATHCAKMADRAAPHGSGQGAHVTSLERGTCVLIDTHETVAALRSTPIEEVWGVGMRLAPVLRDVGIKNAHDLACADDAWVRTRMSVRGLRTMHELRGLSCFPVGEQTPVRKTLLHSRSFGTPASDRATLARAVTYHARKVAETLRTEQLAASTVRVFLVSSYEGKRAVWHVSETLTVPANDTLTFTGIACGMLDRVYRSQVRYIKAGVLAQGIVPEERVPAHTVFGEAVGPRASLMRELDTLRNRMGDVVRVATECGSTSWEARHAMCSPRYTTTWEDVVRLNLAWYV